MGVSIVCLRYSTRSLKAKNVIRILHSSFFILHFPPGVSVSVFYITPTNMVLMRKWWMDMRV